MSAGTRPRTEPAPIPAWVYVAVILALVVAAMAFGYVLLDSPA